MKSTYSKFKNWYRGKYIPYSLEEMIELQRPRYLEPQKDIPFRYEPPLLAKILNSIGRFWLIHWKWIIGTFIALGVLLVMIWDQLY